MYLDHLFKFKKEFKILKGRSVVFVNLPRDRDCNNCVVELSRLTCLFEFPRVLVIYSRIYQDITNVFLFEIACFHVGKYNEN